MDEKTQVNKKEQGIIEDAVFIPRDLPERLGRENIFLLTKVTTCLLLANLVDTDELKRGQFKTCLRACKNRYNITKQNLKSLQKLGFIDCKIPKKDSDKFIVTFLDYDAFQGIEEE